MGEASDESGGVRGQEAPSRELYERQLDRVRLRALAARYRRDADTSALARVQADLAELERVLGGLRTDPRASSRELRLAAKLKLGEAELDLLWTVVAATFDPSLGPQLRDLAGSEARQGITLALHAILSELEPSASRTLARSLTLTHPLVRYGLLELGQERVAAMRTLTAPERLAGYLAGDDTIDAAVIRGGGIARIDAAPHFDAAQLEAVRKIVLTLRGDELVLIEGPSDVGKRTAAALAALAGHRHLVQLDARRIPPGIAELEHAFVALRRECLLGDVLPLLAHIEEIAADPEDRGRAHALARLLDETPIPVLATSTAAGLDLGTTRSIQRVAIPAPDLAARVTLWEHAIGESGHIEVETLAARYQLGAGAIGRAVASARRLAHGEPLTTSALIAGVRDGIADKLGGLATRVDVKQSWDDVVLPVDTLDAIVSLIARVRHAHRVHGEWQFGAKLHRGLGTAALFSGPPGTGKTLVAGMIARELDLELYQVDLSKVVSKWVGETEKQLAKIFDAAEAGHALLLFDEADSLFARRTEVKSAIDRYANLEVNYLLQRIESFGGVAILTTNLDTSIDPALRRRLAAHAVFYPPDLEERKMLWAKMIPPEAPRAAAIDFAALAQTFQDMTGANIRNAVLAAAFLAASESSIITQGHLERAGRSEYRAMGRVTR